MYNAFSYIPSQNRSSLTLDSPNDIVLQHADSKICYHHQMKKTDQTVNIIIYFNDK